MKVVARLRSLWRGIRGTAALDAEMAEEFRLHVELRAEALVRSGLSPDDAARQARLEFGSPEHYADRGRASRGLRPFDDLRLSWLDFKLGFRMLRRYPGLTLIGGLAMAFAIWVGSMTFELVTQLAHPRLPLPDGARVVGIRLWDASASRIVSQSAYDYAVWRKELQTIGDLGAFSGVKQNLVTPDGQVGTADGAEISASGFRLTRVTPLHGRVLLDADEQPGAPAVVVIGHDLWRTRFGGDPAAVGKQVRIGGAPATVVGVMPEGFAFPLSQSFWVPLRLSGVDRPAGGPWLSLFGRLAPNATLDDAQAELAVLSGRIAADYPEARQHVRAQVMPYAKTFIDVSGGAYFATMSVNLIPAMLLLLICSNVALLMFARATARETEIVVRTALGASRKRIVTQLFAEALVLSTVAALIGLVATGWGLNLLMGIVESALLETALPFWISGRISPATMLFAALLAVLSAIIAGVLPGLRVTRDIGAQLKAGVAGGGGPRFGGVWTAVIVAQIAATVASPVFTFGALDEATQQRSVTTGVDEARYLTLALRLDNRALASTDSAARAALRERFRIAYLDLERRLLRDASVAGVAFADALPRMPHNQRLVSLDAGGGAPLNPQWPAYRVTSVSVGRGFLDVLQAPPLSGRDFLPSEYESGRGTPSAPGGTGGPVIVNEAFVKYVLGGRSPIGRRIRFATFDNSFNMLPSLAGQPWHEIVGLVRDMGIAPADEPVSAAVYHPAATGAVYPAKLVVHVRGDPRPLAPRVAAMASLSDAMLQVEDVMTMDRVDDARIRAIDLVFRLLTVLSGLALMLSLAGIYAVMSFTVARRTREIGIRTALGASPSKVVLSIFRQPLRQVTIGVLTGALLLGAFLYVAYEDGGGMPLKSYLFLIAYSAGMFAICLLACIVPTRRALGVQPSEALRADG